MTLPKIPDGKDYSEATWRAGLDEAVRLSGLEKCKTWSDFARLYCEGGTAWPAIIAHATTLLDAGLVKPVVSEAAIALWDEIDRLRGVVNGWKLALDAIQSALDKARAGE